MTEEFWDALNQLNYSQDLIYTCKDLIEEDFRVKLELIDGSWKVATSPKKTHTTKIRQVSIGSDHIQSIIVAGDNNYVETKGYEQETR